jgi:1-deoxy-D-xylulose-5-phosphate reductoisomerase
MTSTKNLTLLGSTGSIGQSTLAVVRLHPERYRVQALCAHANLERLYAQCVEFRPRYAVLGSAEAAQELAGRLAAAGVNTEVLSGAAALEDMARLPEVDTVVAAIVGAAGLPSALAAAQAGKKILLANKESLVMAGDLFMRAAREAGARLLPVDSEHNAIFQSLPREFAGGLPSAAPLPQAGEGSKPYAASSPHSLEGEGSKPCAAFSPRPLAGEGAPQGRERGGISRFGVKKLWLTASGGPFRRFSAEELARVTPEQAVSHPNWSMGKKISVDSASLMNKGLEVIEARWLFDAPPEMIEVVVHPQSVIHSLVEYVDGSFLAQLGVPDMRVPIAHALAYPERVISGVESLNLFQIARLDFEAPDKTRFPCLQLAYDALATGGTASAILNAANEVAVAAFLERRLSFSGIARLVADVLNTVPIFPAESLDAVRAADAAARTQASAWLLTNART